MLKKDLSKKKPWESYEKLLRNNLWGKKFKLKKKKKKKTTIRNEIHKKENKLLKRNNKEKKEILPFVTQYQPSGLQYDEKYELKWLKDLM